jgi:hypothetical protein
MLAEIFMLSVEADVRSLNALTPSSSDTRFVPIELPMSSAGGDPPQQVDSDSLGAQSGHLAAKLSC